MLFKLQDWDATQIGPSIAFHGDKVSSFMAFRMYSTPGSLLRWSGGWKDAAGHWSRPAIVKRWSRGSVLDRWPRGPLYPRIIYRYTTYIARHQGRSNLSSSPSFLFRFLSPISRVLCVYNILCLSRHPYCERIRPKTAPKETVGQYVTLGWWIY